MIKIADFLYRFMKNNTGNLFVIGKVRDNSFDFTIRGDRKNTVSYTVYQHEDGYHVRRTVLTTGINYPQNNQYKLFYNTRTGEWDTFETPEQLIMRLYAYNAKYNK